jgi:hypothetical protein
MGSPIAVKLEGAPLMVPSAWTGTDRSLRDPAPMRYGLVHRPRVLLAEDHASNRQLRSTLLFNVLPIRRHGKPAARFRLRDPYLQPAHAVLMT